MFIILLFASISSRVYFTSGTSMKTNPNAMLTITKNTIYTNVAETEDGDIFWEGLEKERDMSKSITSWLNVKAWTKDSGKPAAHPNSRY
jgi:phosphoenolpyruvate carboxykinase (GTP)